MSAISLSHEPLSAEAFNTCNVVLLHEDSATKKKAIEFCDRLLTRFDQDLDFTISHWSFAVPEELLTSRKTADALAHADIILVSSHGADLPQPIVRWMESCMEKRMKLEGLLAFVIVEPVSALDAGAKLLYRLRQIAFGLKMDFLPLVHPPERGTIAFNWPAPLIETGEQIGNSHWGLNE